MIGDQGKVGIAGAQQPDRRDIEPVRAGKPAGFQGGSAHLQVLGVGIETRRQGDHHQRQDGRQQEKGKPLPVISLEI